jgi:hypothetical protein
MADIDSNSDNTDAAQIEDVRVGYQVAVSLWTYEGAQNWARFNVMLVANSITLALLGLVVTSERPAPSISVVMSLVGLVLCSAWFLITKRGFDYQKYYVLSARELEEHFTSSVIRTVSRGGSFADGHLVTLEVGGKAKELQMSWWSRRASAGDISIFVIVLFAVVYVLALLQAIGVV